MKCLQTHNPAEQSREILLEYFLWGFFRLCCISGTCLNSMCWMGSRGEGSCSIPRQPGWNSSCAHWGWGQARWGTWEMLDVSFGTSKAHLCVVVSTLAGAALLSLMRAAHGHTQHKGLLCCPTLCQLHPVIPRSKITCLTCFLIAPFAYAIATNASSILNFEKWGLRCCLACAGQRNTFTASAEEGMQVSAPMTCDFMSALQHLVHSETPQ